MKTIAIATIFLTCVNLFAQQNLDTVTIRPIKVKDNLFMLKGSGGNMALLTGVDGVLLIDDQFAPLSEKIKKIAAQLGTTPIKYLVNTHVHGDHSGGNDNFRKDGVTIMAHENVRVRMIKPSGDEKPREKDAWPLITFDDKIRLHLNNEDVELIHFKLSAHTDGDAVIRFVNANVYHTGDLFVRYGYPFIDVGRGGSYKGFMAALDQIISIVDEKAVIIPGHGELATRADIKALRDKLADIGKKVEAQIKKGKKPGEIQADEIIKPYEAELGKGFLKGKNFVLLIAEELTAR